MQAEMVEQFEKSGMVARAAPSPDEFCTFLMLELKLRAAERLFEIGCADQGLRGAAWRL
jgi:hypothetical protein